MHRRNEWIHNRQLAHFLSPLALLFFCSCAARSPLSLQTFPTTPPRVIQGQYLVTAKGDLCEYPTSTKKCNLIRAGQVYDVRDFNVVSLLSDSDVAPAVVEYDRAKDRCLTDLKDMPGCEPNFVMELYETDPLLNQQWGVDAIGGRDAWKIQNEASDVLVAVIDTGIDCAHEDLQCALEYDAETGSRVPGAAMDRNGHGTHVAGTICAVGGNGKGVAGTVWRCRLGAYKFLGENGSGSVLTAVRAIDAAIADGADVINASWGSTAYSRALEEAVNRATNTGVVFVAAAGNSATDNDRVPHYPSSSPGVLAVASFNSGGRYSTFSNYGKDSVAVGAPGEGIISTWNTGGYNTISGTSMASPHVAGIAASLYQQAKARGESPSRAKIIERIQSSSTQPSSEPGKTKFGFVNYLRALSADLGAPVKCQQRRCVKCRDACAEDLSCPKLRQCRAGCREKFNCQKGCK